MSLDIIFLNVLSVNIQYDILGMCLRARRYVLSTRPPNAEWIVLTRLRAITHYLLTYYLVP